MNGRIRELAEQAVNITYGRDVGYKIEQEVFDEEIHSILATKIRKEMGLNEKILYPFQYTTRKY